MILLELSDFNTYYRLAQSSNTDPVLQSYIDRFEESYIKRILGVELGQKFIDDIQGNDEDSDEIEPRFQAILDPFIKQRCGNGSIYESKGMKAILAGLIYSEYVEDDAIKHAQAGTISNQAEVSNVATPAEAMQFGEEKWNSSVISLHAVQWFCGSEEPDTYPEFAGTYFRPKYGNLL